MKNRVIPFYGGEHPELFAIERRCMDRDGHVVAYLNDALPQGLVLDVGAGNGYTAVQLSGAGRTIVALEPDPLMVDSAKPLIWAKGVAQEIPFHDNAFAAAYATWAFFFDGIPDIDEGLAELERVVTPGGPIIIVDNAGGDEFCALAPGPIHSNAAWWRERGFSATILKSSFRFDDLDEAKRLLAFYFGPAGAAGAALELSYNIAVYQRTSGSGRG